MAWTDQKNKIQGRLLQWFKKNQRDLPWRKTSDPYAIWVSEIMLQQTQVATVIPYYEKFLKTFPTLQHLSRANISDVLKVWEGLGYYSRARNFHQASRVVVNQFDGKIPDTLISLLTLPGIGRYTAGAILSIAFHKTAPILDGNAKRVLSRLFAIAGTSQKTEKTLWKYSASLIPEGHASSFNQALMDLGAMICTPKDPQCLKCPLCDHCKAWSSGKPEKFPSRTIKKKIPHVKAVSAVIQKSGKVLLKQRPPKGLLGGLWEFPNWPTDGKKDVMEYVWLKVKSELGLKVKGKVLLGTFKQTYSHFKVTRITFHCEGTKTDHQGKWVPIPHLRLLPMSRIDRKIADAVQGRRYKTNPNPQ